MGLLVTGENFVQFLPDRWIGFQIVDGTNKISPPVSGEFQPDCPALNESIADEILKRDRFFLPAKIPESEFSAGIIQVYFLYPCRWSDKYSQDRQDQGEPPHVGHQILLLDDRSPENE